MRRAQARSGRDAAARGRRMHERRASEQRAARGGGASAAARAWVAARRRGAQQARAHRAPELRAASAAARDSVAAACENTRANTPRSAAKPHLAAHGAPQGAIRRRGGAGRRELAGRAQLRRSTKALRWRLACWLCSPRFSARIMADLGRGISAEDVARCGGARRAARGRAAHGLPTSAVRLARAAVSALLAARAPLQSRARRRARRLARSKPAAAACRSRKVSPTTRPDIACRLRARSVLSAAGGRRAGAWRSAVAPTARTKTGLGSRAKVRGQAPAHSPWGCSR
jgi:hypothetical protein